MRRIRTMDGNLVNREEAVKTVDNKVIKKEDSVYCSINGYYYHKDDKRITKDFYLKDNYVPSDGRGVTKILISIDKKGNTYAYTSLNQRAFSLEHIDNVDNYPVLIHTAKLPIQYGLYKIAVELGLREIDHQELIFSDLDTYKYANKMSYRPFKNVFKYDPKNLTKSTEMGTFSPTYRITEGIKNTFGVELETSIGRINPWEYQDLNIDCVYDGSLKDEDGKDLGGEYVTGILKGDMGFNQVNKICRTLAKKCEVNKRCGVHVHVGINPTKHFIVNLYKVLQDIQDEIFSIIPKGRRNGPHSKCIKEFDFSILKKTNNATKEEFEYNINYLYDKIYRHNSCRDVNVRDGRYVKHPMGDKCGFRKETPRYCWVNFIPAMFIRDHYKGENKDYKDFTIEFRPHPGSLNFNKIKNWIKICLAIVNFTENNATIIANKKITLDQIINSVYPKSGSALSNYVLERQELFRKSAGEKIDMDDAEENNIKGIKQLI